MTKKISGLLKAITFCVVAGLFSVVLLSCSSNIVDDGAGGEMNGYDAFWYRADINLLAEASPGNPNQMSFLMRVMHTTPDMLGTSVTVEIPEVRVDNELIEPDAFQYQDTLNQYLGSTDSLDFRLIFNDEVTLRYNVPGFDPVRVEGLDQVPIPGEPFAVRLLETSIFDSISCYITMYYNDDQRESLSQKLADNQTMAVSLPASLDSVYCHLRGYLSDYYIEDLEIVHGDTTYYVSRSMEYLQKVMLYP